MPYRLHREEASLPVRGRLGGFPIRREVRSLLVGAVESRVHRHGSDVCTHWIGFRLKQGLDPATGAICRETSVTLPCGLPGAKLLRQVAPCNPVPVPVDNTCDDLTLVPERASAPAVGSGQ